MIRQATINDAPRIAEIHVDSWRVTYRGIVPDDYLAALDVNKREEAWKERSSNESAPVYVACNADRIIGFCHISASRDTGTEGTSEITSIYIDPANLRNGYGRELFSAAFTFAIRQGYRDVTLWVLIENKVARQFYQAMGFFPDGATKTEDRPGFQFNEIRYRRELTKEGEQAASPNGP